MAAHNASIEVHGANKAAVDLHRMGERGTDIRRVSERVRTVYRKSNERRFYSDGVGSWPPLAASTRERKAQQHLSVDTMVARGALRRALTSPRASGQVDRRDAQEFRFGTTLYYARFHDTGRGAPKRELIALTSSDRRQITDLISAYVAQAKA